MKKVYVLYSLDKHKYYTGKFWREELTSDIDCAETYGSIEEIEEAMRKPEDDDQITHYHVFVGYGPWEVKTIYFVQ